MKLAKQTEAVGFLTGALLASGWDSSSLDRRAPCIAGHLPSMAQAKSSPESLWQSKSIPTYFQLPAEYGTPHGGPLDWMLKAHMCHS